MSETVLVSRSGGVVTLTLNRPEVRNAMNAELVNRLLELLRELDQDQESRVIVLSGAGAAFCAGADLKEVRPQSFWEMSDRVDLSTQLYGYVAEMSKPVIAAVNGHALAGGCGLAMSCDLVIAAEEANFGYPEVQRGLVAALIMVSLERLVGRRTALELLLTGRRIPAAEALALGMVNRVVPAADVLLTAQTLAAQIAAFPPNAVALTKRVFYQVAGLATGAALNRARDASLLFRQSSEALAGARAFVERNQNSG